MRAIGKIEHLNNLKKALIKFEEFVLRNNITVEQLAPAFCSNWMQIERYRGNSMKWKLEYRLQKYLIYLHYDIACLVFKQKVNETDVDFVSSATKIIYGTVGSCAGNFWHSFAYIQKHYGTTILMRIWNTAIVSENIIL